MSFPFPSAAEFASMTPDQFCQFWTDFRLFKDNCSIAEGVYHVSEIAVEEGIFLKRAGWTPEFDAENRQPHSWKWRRPGHGTRPGKLFGSSTQGFNWLWRTRLRDAQENGAE